MQGFIQVILALLTCSWTCTGSLVLSSRFHTSTLPSSFPMKKTAGLDRDQHPAQYVWSEFADRTMGPSWWWSRGKEHSICSVVSNPGWSRCCDQSCYHDFLPPDGKIPLAHRQNDIFEEGRPLHCVDHPVVDTETVEGLGPCNTEVKTNVGKSTFV